MKKLLLLVPLLLVGCDQFTSEPEIGWKISGGELECTNPDAADGSYICIWYCRDYRGREDVDIVINYDERAIYLKIRESTSCGLTDFNPSPQKKE